MLLNLKRFSFTPKSRFRTGLEMHGNTSRYIRNDHEKTMKENHMSELPVELSHPPTRDMNFLECTYGKQPNMDKST